MPTNVIMPQMGESIAEGTLTRWMKKIGDSVKRDEPLFEISTDKVDAEIPSPSAGVLLEILVPEGTTVPINTVVAKIGEAGEATATAPAAEAAARSRPRSGPRGRSLCARCRSRSGPGGPRGGPAAPARGPAGGPSLHDPAPGRGNEGRPPEAPLFAGRADHRRGEGRRPGAGARHRHLRSRDEVGPRLPSSRPEALRLPLPLRPFLRPPHLRRLRLRPPSRSPPRRSPRSQRRLLPLRPPPSRPAPATPVIAFPAGANVSVEAMSPMRKKIAQRMVESKTTSAHVATVFEVDYTAIAKLREKVKDRFAAQYGTKLSYMPFIFKAVIAGLKARPSVNASVSGDDIVYHRDINLGVAVSLDWGLIVPVIKNADDLSLVGLARAANDLAGRARTKKLLPDDVQGGTFTITNPGVYGSLFGTPIINQPQVAILNIGTIEKRAKVVELPDGTDTIAVRTMGYLALSFDHRLVDGAEADAFMGVVKATLESGTFPELD